MSDDVEHEISEAAFGRRTFLRRLALGSAFAVPVVSSFSMAGLRAVSAQANPGPINGNQTSIYGPNQTFCNPNQTSVYNPNQTYGQPSGPPIHNPNQTYGQPPGPPVYNPNQPYGRPPGPPIYNSNQEQGLIGFLEEVFSLLTGHPHKPI
ncbi:MAG TPA: hypothetical protein VGG41_15015 [Solirubrobacteraceae bacterium]|jgi:hypothetical protein